MAGLDPPPGDELGALVGPAVDGDRDALEALLRGSYEPVYRVCRRMVGDEQDAADAAQEALINVSRGLRRFDGRSRYSTWLYRIAVNASLDELRRRKRRPAAAPSLSLVGSELGSVPATGGGPEDVAGWLDLEAALMSLPTEFRAAVVLRDVCGLDYAEIAEVLSIPGGTVRSRIARGRGWLAAHLVDDGGAA